MAIVPAVAVNVAVVFPDATVTEAGTLSDPTELARETKLPPTGAAELSVTRQVEDPPGLRDVGRHEIPVTVGCTTAPSMPLIGKADPSGETPSGPVTLMVAIGVPGVTATFTEATRPF